MIVVSSPAAHSALTTLTTLKSELKIGGGEDDAWLQRRIDSVSSFIARYLGVRMATDGTASLGRETVVETIRLDRARTALSTVRRRDLRLGRWPVSSVVSVVEDGVTLDAADFEVDVEGGAITRLSGDASSFWTGPKIVVTYAAGWLLPEDDNRNLPDEIEEAALEMLTALVSARGRDPAIKSESTDGIDSVTYFFGSPGDGALPASVVAKLEPHRNY